MGTLKALLPMLEAMKSALMILLVTTIIFTLDPTASSSGVGIDLSEELGSL